MSTTLTHADGCPSDRLDITEHPEQGVIATHCVDCSAHEVRTAAGDIVPPPETTGPYAEQQQGAAWETTLEPAGASQPDHLGKTEWDHIERNRI
ncbi:hypothetical protein [Microbacterium trichothecenolyticum]|uniref:Uncharacterized protein n=1 Tax=Microbacterium trichothecenolyticum TaxID=69370 RepID=A0ABU0TT83_MICTR|nr:hypothetical protein [Microbacterium trichothecenolyticum]MDQ1122162.1 hypothetical protein [Microbacterium trichothecenolyticum]